MENDTELVIKATRKASRFLQRDYFELENLQASSKSRINFCQKACSRAMETLHENLHRYFKTIIFSNQDAEKMNFTGKAVLIETLDGLQNFERSLPFFAIMVTIVTNKDGKIVAETSVINFPALGEIYYAEQGRGALLERHASNFSSAASRVRMSGVSDLTDAIVASNITHLELAQKYSKNIRIFESYSYNLILLISGKIDILVIKPRAISSLGIQLFIIESSGQFFIKEKALIASNFKLHKIVEQHVK